MLRILRPLSRPLAQRPLARTRQLFFSNIPGKRSQDFSEPYSERSDETGASDTQLKDLDIKPVFITIGVLFLGAGLFRGVLMNEGVQAQENPVTWDELKAQDATTSAAIIKALRADRTFQNFARLETAAIQKRDDEDGEKLQAGIQLAINKRVIPANIVVEPIRVIEVESKSPAQVAEEIISALGPAANTGCILTLQGLSGTGKGTTVDILKKTLPNSMTWSNGNVFRALTLLVTRYAEQNNVPFEQALQPENLQAFTKMLSFQKFGSQFDIQINGLGINVRVSEIQNTMLKSPQVSKFIPTVAENTQGEVINFVQSCLNTMVAENFNVLLEGREQTLNYIRTPHRFELKLRDPQVIGQRRAAQLIGAETLSSVKKELASPTATKQPPNHMVSRHLAASLNRLYEQMHAGKL